jgi:uncharacterized protein with von Willebrand factor type A (vWA) domain
MIHGLQRFFGELDEAGVRTSPAERIEAVRAVHAVGVEEPSRFRQALRATLVKRSAQRAIFDQVFDRFFVAPGRAPGRRRRRRAGGAGEAGPASRRQTGQAQAPVAAAEPRRPSEVLRGKLRSLRAGREQRWGRLRHVVAQADHRGPHPRPSERSAVPELRDLRRRPGVQDHEALGREVRRLVERIRLRSGRRLQAMPSGRPYMRRLFRDSQRSGGVPFRLPRRRRRQRTPRVLLLIDVSWSTAPAAGCFLEMAGEFLRLGRQTRVLFFVDRAVEVTEPLARWLGRRRRPSFDAFLRSIDGLNLDAPSDYGRTFHSLSTSASRPRGRRTVLLVLGDGRTNVFDPLAWALDEVVQGCGAALWLVPEPVAGWGTGDSALPRYLPHVDTVVEAGDLRGLARGVSELLRRL